MSIKLHILRATGRLEPYVDRIETVFRNSVSEIKEKVSVENVDVVMSDSPRGALEEMGGVGGYIDSPNEIWISLDPGNEKFSDSFEQSIRGSIAHELHHAARVQEIGWDHFISTLIEHLISDGLADHFAQEFTGIKTPWSQALSDEDIKKYLLLAKSEFNNKEFNKYSWFFGGDDIPRWTGYSLGYYLVGEYLKKHPNETAASLYNVKAEEFV